MEGLNAFGAQSRQLQERAQLREGALLHLFLHLNLASASKLRSVDAGARRCTRPMGGVVLPAVWGNWYASRIETRSRALAARRSLEMSELAIQCALDDTVRPGCETSHAVETEPGARRGSEDDGRQPGYTAWRLFGIYVATTYGRGEARAFL